MGGVREPIHLQAIPTQLQHALEEANFVSATCEVMAGDTAGEVVGYNSFWSAHKLSASS